MVGQQGDPIIVRVVEEPVHETSISDVILGSLGLVGVLLVCALILGAVLGGGLLFGRSFIAIMFDQMFNLTATGWRILTLRWALFFLGMAILNEVIWRTQSTDFWVGFKAFGAIPLTMIFAIGQMPVIRRYHLEPASLEASEAEAGDVSKGKGAR